jgi:hypothetical protein
VVSETALLGRQSIKDMGRQAMARAVCTRFPAMETLTQSLQAVRPSKEATPHIRVRLAAAQHIGRNARGWGSSGVHRWRNSKCPRRSVSPTALR